MESKAANTASGSSAGPFQLVKNTKSLAELDLAMPLAGATRGRC